MAGKNRFLQGIHRPLGKGRFLRPPAAPVCVFISHQRDDSDMARAVAETLTELNIDYWLDLDQIPEGTLPKTQQEHLRLTEAIETGLQSATHLLALITLNARASWWVPFEIGSCRALQKDLAFLLQRYLSDPPSYVAAGDSLPDQQALLKWARELTARPGAVYLEPQLKQQPNRLDRFVYKVAPPRT